MQSNIRTQYLNWTAEVKQAQIEILGQQLTIVLLELYISQSAF